MKPLKSEGQTKHPTDWRKIVRRTVNRRRGTIKKTNINSSWRNNRDGFMVTSREHQPTKNQIDSLEKRNNKKYG